MFKKQNSITYTFYYDLADAIQGQGGLELGSWKRAIRMGSQPGSGEASESGESGGQASCAGDWGRTC